MHCGMLAVLNDIVHITWQLSFYYICTYPSPVDDDSMHIYESFLNPSWFYSISALVSKWMIQHLVLSLPKKVYKDFETLSKYVINK